MLNLTLNRMDKELLKRMSQELNDEEYYLLVIMIHATDHFARLHSKEFAENFGTNGAELVQKFLARFIEE